MPDLPDVVQLAIPVYLAAVLFEIGVGWRRGDSPYEARDTGVNLVTAVAFLIASIAVGFVGVGVLRTVETRWGLVDWGWSVGAFALCFVLDDLRKYWLHRVQHTCRWFWAAHVTHHSSQHYNFSTALRNPPTVFLTQAFLFRLPLALLGFEWKMIAFVAGLNSVYQFFTHTELVRRLPRPIEFVFTTPSHHRVHHGTNPRYLDANYAPVFILWDRLFGTFVQETDDDPVRYGLVSNLGTLDPIRVMVHEWVALVRDATLPGLTATERFRYVFGRPGYSHDGSRETSAMVRARHAAARRPR